VSRVRLSGDASSRRPGGLRNFISSSRPWPSGVSTIATSTRVPSSPTTRSAQLTQHFEAELDEECRRRREVVDHGPVSTGAGGRHSPGAHCLAHFFVRGGVDIAADGSAEGGINP
jgi:hypothetical protein